MASSTTKMELDEDAESVKRELFNLVQAYDNGISETELSKTMSSISISLRMNAINALTNEGKIQLCKKGSDLIYRAIDPRISANHSSLLGANISIEERAVYKVIENAGNKGIWNREIRNQTKLALNQMTKVLKNLETKKLIKAVKSVNASKKKLYMLYGLEPDKSVTGGAWYSGTEFEAEYVQMLHDQCHEFVKRRLHHVTSTTNDGQEDKKPALGGSTGQIDAAPGDDDFLRGRDSAFVSSMDVKDYIEDLKISNVKLTLQDIEMILDTIVYDGLIEKITKRDDSHKTIPIKIKREIPAAGCGADRSAPSEQTKVLTSEDEDADTSKVTHYYRALPQLVESSPVMRSPCGHCPYVYECRPSAVITPENCLYFERWFET